MVPSTGVTPAQSLEPVLPLLPSNNQTIGDFFINNESVKPSVLFSTPLYTPSKRLFQSPITSPLKRQCVLPSLNAPCGDDREIYVGDPDPTAHTTDDH